MVRLKEAILLTAVGAAATVWAVRMGKVDFQRFKEIAEEERPAKVLVERKLYDKTLFSRDFRAGELKGVDVEREVEIRGRRYTLRLVEEGGILNLSLTDSNGAAIPLLYAARKDVTFLRVVATEGGVMFVVGKGGNYTLHAYNPDSNTITTYRMPSFNPDSCGLFSRNGTPALSCSR